MSEWDSWIGREEHRQDRVDPGHAARWLATLDRAAAPDNAVPQGFHFCLCLPDAPTTGAPPAPGEGRFDASDWQVHRMLVPAEPLLFRYSALTFNSHRIHSDLAYATGEEGYRGLIVHGPLTATLLLDLARRELGDNALLTFAFRGLSPGLCGEELHLVMRGSGDAIELGAFASDGRQVMSASAAA